MVRAFCTSIAGCELTGQKVEPFDKTKVFKSFHVCKYPNLFFTAALYASYLSPGLNHLPAYLDSVQLVEKQ